MLSDKMWQSWGKYDSVILYLHEKFSCVVGIIPMRMTLEYDIQVIIT